METTQEKRTKSTLQKMDDQRRALIEKALEIERKQARITYAAEMVVKGRLKKEADEERRARTRELIQHGAEFHPLLADWKLLSKSDQSSLIKEFSTLIRQQLELAKATTTKMGEP